MAAPAGYGQFCPVAKAAEVLATRWTPLILRELVSGSTRFNEIHRGVPLMSRALLSQRLKALEAAGIVERGAHARDARMGDYRLTEAGEALRPVIVGTLGRAMGRKRARRPRLGRGRADVGHAPAHRHRRAAARPHRARL
jgi:DNA-binding HxlR family transcriptional regulator